MPIDAGSAHDLHALAQADPQQTPWAQLPDMHSRLSAQKAPFTLRPHELSVHALPGRHCASIVHAVKQRAPLHANGAQARASGATHWPVALQADGGVYTLLSQCSAAQIVPGSYDRQPAAPSHFPSCPQLCGPWSTHTVRGSAAPAGTGVQRPIEDGSAQLRQAPPHAPSQQIPSTQKLLVQSVAAAHGCPFGLRPQLWFASHTWPSLQSTSLLQVEMQAPSRHR